MIETSHITPCVAYLGRAEGESEAALSQHMADELETASERPRSETVLDAAPGTIPAVPGYFRRTREICDCNGGFRSSARGYAAWDEPARFSPAIGTASPPKLAPSPKGWARVLSRWGRCCVPPAIEAGSGISSHGHTYGPSDRRSAGGPDPAGPGRAALAGADHGRKARGGPALGPWRAPHVGDIRGQDLFRGIERAKDHASPPFPPGRRAHARIGTAAFEAGLLCHPMGGTIDGRQGDQVLRTPPLTPDGTHALEITDKLQFLLTALR